MYMLYMCVFELALHPCVVFLQSPFSVFYQISATNRRKAHQDTMFSDQCRNGCNLADHSFISKIIGD